MKKHYSLILSLIVCSLFGFIDQAQATHLAGADLYYEYLGGNQYEVTTYYYRDCSGVSPSSSITLNVKSNNCLNTTVTLFPTGLETILSSACNSQLTTCDGGSATGVLKIEYSGIVTLPSCANGTDWLFSWNEGDRNNAITNMSSSSNDDLYISATLDHTNSNGNSSPIFSNDPVSFVCIGQNFTFNHGAIDPDGDSLAYSMVTPMATPTTAITWASGFSATNPISSSTPFTLDPVTGDINFTPSSIEVDILAIRVDEYRAGKLIGSTIRDIQIWVISCGNNTIPTLTGMNGTTDYSMSTCVGGQICFDVFANDANTGDNLTVSWNQGIASGTFSPSNNNTPSAEAKFCWTPTIADVSNTPHIFTVTVKDDACPSVGQQIYTFSITVNGIVPGAITGVVVDESCQGANDGSITLNLNGVTAPYTILWSNSATTATITNLSIGQYIVDVLDSAGCNIVDTFNVGGSTVPCCDYQITGDDSLCPGNTTCVWLEATQTVTNGIIGMNYCLSYDTAWFTPTGSANLGQVVYAAIGQGNGESYQLNTVNPGQVYATIYYDATVAAGTFWQGSGDVICVEFNVNPNTPTGAYNFSACEVEESYPLHEVTQCAIAGGVTILQNNNLSGSINYWNYDGVSNGPARPLMYDINNPSDYLITTINSTNGSGVWEHTDLNGEFTWNASDGNMVVIDRDILGEYYDTTQCTDVFPFINGADAYLAALISNFDMLNLLDSNVNWIPNKYQMIAGDVNMNDKVRANDVTHIMSRSVRSICEFPQVWNYTFGNISNPLPDTLLGPSKDWRFLPSTDTSTTQTSGVIAEWTFENLTTNLPVLPIVPSYQDAVVAIAGADVLGGNNNGSPAVCTGNETWSTNFWTTDSIADSLEFIDYSVQVSGSVEVSSFSMDLNASSFNSAMHYDLYYTVNGDSEVYVGSGVVDTLTCSNHNYSFTSLNLLGGDMISFQLHPYGQNSNAQTATIRMDNVVLNGVFNSSNGTAPADCVADVNYPVYSSTNATSGYWRDDVPNVSDTLSLFTIDTSTVCPNYMDITFDAVLLGDLTATWDPASAFGTMVRASSVGEMSFEVSKVTGIDNEYIIEVSYQHPSIRTSVDFRMDFDESKMTILDVQEESASTDANMVMEWNNFGNEKLYVSSYTLDGINTTDVLYTIHVKTESNFEINHLGTILPMINGEIVNTNIIIQSVSGINTYELAGYFDVYPNPSNGMINIEYALDQEGLVRLSITNVLGQTVYTTSLGNMSTLTTKTVDLSGFEKGVYNIKLSSDRGEITKRVILE